MLSIVGIIKTSFPSKEVYESQKKANKWLLEDGKDQMNEDDS